MDEILNRDHIDLAELKENDKNCFDENFNFRIFLNFNDHLNQDRAFNGCPDSGSCRSLCWRLLLSALPADRSEWDSTNQIQRENYRTFVQEFVIKPENEKSVRSTDPLR